MKVTVNIKNNSFFGLALILLALLFLFGLLYSIFQLMPENAGYKAEAVSLKEGWQYKQDVSEQWSDLTLNGKPINNNENSGTVWYRLIIPSFDNIDSPAIYFDRIFSEDIVIFIDDDKVYSHNSQISNRHNNYIISRIDYIVPIAKDAANKALTVMISSKMNKIGLGRAVYLGEHRELQKMQFRSELDNIIIGFFLIIFGLFILPNIIYISGSDKYAFLYLSFFVISLGAWNLTQPISNLMVLYDNREFWAIVSQNALMLFMIFFTSFFRIIFSSHKSKKLDLFWKFNIVFFAIVLVVNTVSVFSIFTNLSYFDTAWKVIVIADFSVKIFVVVKRAIKGNQDAKLFTFSFVMFASIGIVELIVYLTVYKIPYFYKWSMLIFIASLILIMGRRFSETHKKLVKYSEELKNSNDTLNNAWEEIYRKNNEINSLNITLEHKVKERTKELQAAMDKLLEAQEQLVRSERLATMTRLVAGVAHEINTPIGVGVTAASYLDREVKHLEEVYNANRMKKRDFEGFLGICKELADAILHNFEKAVELIKGLRRITVNQYSEVKEVFNVLECINELLLSFCTELNKNNHSVKVDCPDDLSINSYPGVLSQILTSLLMNSLLHAYEEGQGGNIAIEVSITNQKFIMKYSNDGKFIDKDSIDKIFEPFYTTRKHKGSIGLGLNVVYNLVAGKLNGDIVCESGPGKGVSFTIKFNM